MENKVSIYFFNRKAGELSQDKYGTLCFQYDQEYLNSDGEPISHCLPLMKDVYYGNEAHAFSTGEALKIPQLEVS